MRPLCMAIQDGVFLELGKKTSNGVLEFNGMVSRLHNVYNKEHYIIL